MLSLAMAEFDSSIQFTHHAWFTDYFVWHLNPLFMMQGQASIMTTFSQAQAYNITAQFSGSPDGLYLASKSAPMALLINPLPVGAAQP